jgi:membrane-associated phospholipid phosphatase
MRPFLIGRFWQDFRHDFFPVAWVLLQRTLSTLRREWWRALLFFLSSLMVAFVLFQNDDHWVAVISSQPQPYLTRLARNLSFWGDYPTGILLGSMLLWFAGWSLHKISWREIAVVCLLASALAGINSNIFRISLGRPRPSAGLVDGFYGPHADSKYQGFPSGHAATAFGVSTALTLAVPELALPAQATALAICWSRVYLTRHHVTDVTVGGALGIIWGAAVGAAYRRSLAGKTGPKHATSLLDPP